MFFIIKLYHQVCLFTFIIKCIMLTDMASQRVLLSLMLCVVLLQHVWSAETTPDSVDKVDKTPPPSPSSTTPSGQSIYKYFGQVLLRELQHLPSNSLTHWLKYSNTRKYFSKYFILKAFIYFSIFILLLLYPLSKFQHQYLLLSKTLIIEIWVNRANKKVYMRQM